MLVLTRKVDESIFIGDDVEVVLIEIDRGKVRLGIKAPADKLILRKELVKDLPHAGPGPVDALEG